MKSTVKISRPARDGESQRAFSHSINNSPATDWSFQPSAPEIRGGGTASFQRPSSVEGFRSMSQQFFDAESKRSYRLEAGVFVLIAALAVWPMVLAAQAAIALLR